MQKEAKVQEIGDWNLTLGKLIGLVVVVITEIVILFSCGLVWYDWKNDKTFDTGLIGNIVFYQVVVLTVVWGAKAGSNFTNALKLKFSNIVK
jgi:hypothetical protein